MTQPPLRRRTDLEPNEPALRALIVDDDEGYRFFIASVVARFGFVTVSASDGAQALEVLRNSAPFDLLVIDCEMPRVGGLDLIVTIRDDARFADVFAMMLTAREDVQTKINALRLGFDDFVPKSASELEISAKLSAARRIVIRQRRLDNAVRELHGLANRDELTGLHNRRFFFAEAERLLAEGRTISLIVFDLDEFKRINDTFGHQAGDRVLRDIGRLFLHETRREDLIARYGGDEFVMLVPELDPEEVEAVARRLAAGLTELTWTFGATTVGMSVSSGIACSSLLAQPEVAQLLAAGDRDRYKNKWVRRNPEADPSLYEYDSARDAEVVDFIRDTATLTRRSSTPNG